jgi:hypothetical protein
MFEMLCPICGDQPPPPTAQEERKKQKEWLKQLKSMMGE